MSELNAVVAVYGTHIEAEGAVKELQRAGIDMRTLSIVGKDSHTDEHVVGYYNVGEPAPRVLLETAHDRVRHPGGQIGADRAERVRGRVNDPRGDLHHAVPSERRRTGAGLVEDDAERPDVGAGVHAPRRE